MARSFSTVRRVLLLLPLFVLLAAGSSELATSPLKWSAERSYCECTVQDWVASLSPFIVAAPALLSSFWGLWEVFRLTRRSYRIHYVHLAVGLFSTTGLALLEWQLAQRSSPYSSFTYGQFFPDSGSGAVTSLTTTVFTTLIFLGSAAAGVYLYCRAVVSEGTKRFDRLPDELDAIGELIASMHEERRNR
jgi:hypothetical protein